MNEMEVSDPEPSNDKLAERKRQSQGEEKSKRIKFVCFYSY